MSGASRDQHGKPYARIYERLERKCVLWAGGRCQMWERGHNTVTQERTTGNIFCLGYR